MEKQYFESFDNKKIPYLFFKSKREKNKNLCGSNKNYRSYNRNV